MRLSHDAILVRRFDGGIESWNSGAEQLYGYSARAGVGRACTSCCRPSFRKPLAGDRGGAAEGGCWAGELHQRHRDGRALIVSANFQLVRGDDGVARVLEANRDITERRRAEEELRQTTERERFLAEVIENATTPFGIGAPDGRLVLFNRAFAELTGYSREELEERRLTWAANLTPPEWRQREAEILAMAARTGETVRYEKEYLRKDGSRVPIELCVQPVRDEAGSLIHYRSFVIDITARKAAERRLAYLASFPEQNANPIVEVDLEGRVRYANPAAVSLLPGIREQGAAHPWLRGWESALRSIRDDTDRSPVRVVTAGGRSYHQAFYFMPEEQAVRVYGIETTVQTRAEAERDRLAQQRGSR